MINIQIGDNVELIKQIESGSVQLIYFNPPFNITKKDWDAVPLEWNALWVEMWRVLKPNGAVIIHASIPFSWELIRQQPWSKHLKYCYYWNKQRATGYLNTGYAPLRKMEEVLVYFKKKPVFNWKTNPAHRGGVVDEEVPSATTGGYYGDFARRRVTKNKVPKGTPSDYIEIPRGRPNTTTGTTTDFTRPDEIMKFFVETYTNSGDTVLDVTCGDGRCGAVCEALGRNFIGFDKRDCRGGGEVGGLPPPTFDTEKEGNMVEAKLGSAVHGYGLFATRDIPPSTKICDYIGEKLTWQEYKDRQGGSTKLPPRYYYKGRNLWIILSDKEPYLSSNPVNYINEGSPPNVVLKGGSLWTTTGLKAGEELFLSYPKNYRRDGWTDPNRLKI
jgi:16S rRNA G966 N2-methylase RsmD